jgi:hypothetical protein
MSYLEHEEGKEGCGCSSCDLFDTYLEAVTAYKTRKPYRTFEIKEGGAGEVETNLNELQAAGYELAHAINGHRAHNRIVIMRSMPPMPPTAQDVLSEINRRREGLKNAASDKDIDNFGPTMGSMQ